MNKEYYTVGEICPFLNTIHPKRGAILSELELIRGSKWELWPEKELYSTPGDRWKIFPFYAFNIWVSDNVKLCPILSNWLKQIPNLKLATLSLLTPDTTLKPHQGWGSHSNHVIRCHYGLEVPNKGCYMVVNNVRVNQKNGRWLLFDDSKTHWAANESKRDRTVLIIDVERPKWVETGGSEIGDTKELQEIIKYFREKEIS